MEKGGGMEGVGDKNRPQKTPFPKIVLGKRDMSC